MAKKPAQVPSAAAVEPSAPESAAVDEPVGLPNAVDIDARFIKGPVLTRQGWVVPAEDWQKANRAEFEAHWAKQSA